MRHYNLQYVHYACILKKKGKKRNNGKQSWIYTHYSVRNSDTIERNIEKAIKSSLCVKVNIIFHCQHHHHHHYLHCQGLLLLPLVHVWTSSHSAVMPHRMNDSVTIFVGILAQAVDTQSMAFCLVGYFSWVLLPCDHGTMCPTNLVLWLWMDDWWIHPLVVQGCTTRRNKYKITITLLWNYLHAAMVNLKQVMVLLSYWHINITKPPMVKGSSHPPIGAYSHPGNDQWLLHPWGLTAHLGPWVLGAFSHYTWHPML